MAGYDKQKKIGCEGSREKDDVEEKVWNMFSRFEICPFHSQKAPQIHYSKTIIE
jgi:hypothetical protein